MESLVERELNEKSKQFLNEITENEDDNIKRKLKHSERFVSTTDPDARVSYKQGKLPALNHLGIISVDTENHVICGAMAELADKRDAETTEDIIGQTIENLQDSDLKVTEVLADTNYSSGESYRFLQENNITAYIPTIGGYSSEKEGFTYNEEEDCYICSQGVKLPFKGIGTQRNRKVGTKEYRAITADCRNCPLKEKCCGKAKYKQVKHSVDKPYYDQAYKLLNTRQGKRKMRLRGKTVEPVWGTLLHFRGLRKVYTKGNDLANKQVLMAATAYNLKKLIGFKSIKSAANAIKNIAADLKMTVSSQTLLFLEYILFGLNYRTIRKMKMALYYRS